MKLVSSRKTSPGRKRTQSPEKERQKAGGPSAAALEAGAMDPDQLKEMLRAAIAEFVKMFNVRAPGLSCLECPSLVDTPVCSGLACPLRGSNPQPKPVCAAPRL